MDGSVSHGSATSPRVTEIQFGCAILLTGGPDRRIVVAGKMYRFEDSPRCGPVVLDRNGIPLAHQPNGKSPFWGAVQLWIEQGRRLAEGEVGNLCQFDTPPEPKLVHIVGKHYKYAAA